MRKLFFWMTLLSLALGVAGCRSDLGNLFDVY